jgi:hypothetical protein
MSFKVRRGYVHLTRQQAEQFQARWDAVREVELEELRAMPTEEKFRQLAELMASARALGWMLPDRPEDKETLDRWRRLRLKSGVEQ